MKGVSTMSLDDRLFLSSPSEDEMLAGSDEPSTLPSFLLTADQVAPQLGLLRSQVYKLINSMTLAFPRGEGSRTQYQSPGNDRSVSASALQEKLSLDVFNGWTNDDTATVDTGVVVAPKAIPIPNVGTGG